jgi:hypothetical protein
MKIKETHVLVVNPTLLAAKHGTFFPANQYSGRVAGPQLPPAHRSPARTTGFATLTPPYRWRRTALELVSPAEWCPDGTAYTHGFSKASVLRQHQLQAPLHLARPRPGV